ncbi:MAG: hypothetical protein Q8N99_06240 [Nanoarchaeota archaeon]|nr:hypothetical protein [Nanoarchaeota archaeon]
MKKIKFKQYLLLQLFIIFILFGIFFVNAAYCNDSDGGVNFYIAGVCENDQGQNADS